MGKRVPDRLHPYLELLVAFVAGEISAPAFERRYLDLYLEDDARWSDKEFAILDRLFAEVDVYVADPALRAELGDDPEEVLDDAGLLAAANHALDRLRAL